MTKTCVQCGRDIQTDDWYSYIRTKYCKGCAADVRRRQKAAYMQELRRSTRETNRLTRELCKSQQQEIELLRQELIRQRERVAKLEEGTKR